MRPLDRALGRAAPTPSTAGDFSTRPFGATKADAAAIAAAAQSAPGGGGVTGSTGSAGAKSNMTSSDYGHVAASDRGAIQ